MSRFKDFGNDLYSGKLSIDFVGRRKTWYLIGVAVVVLAILLPILRGGFSFGIQFTGGSEFRVDNVTTQSQEIALQAVAGVTDVPATVASVGLASVVVQTQQLTDVVSEEVRLALASAYGVESGAVASSFIGPNWGADVTRQALTGLVVFLVLVSLLMAVYFRSWKMSVAALTALAHDLIITVGIYGGLGLEISPAAVIGFLTILSYSLYDTVVVFDKVRENTEDIEFSDTRTFSEQVNLAVNQTLVRSINTSVVAVLPVAGILFIGSLLLGAGTLTDIALALFIGTIVGTYSSVFIAAPVYSQLREKEPKYLDAKERVLANRA